MVDLLEQLSAVLDSAVAAEAAAAAGNDGGAPVHQTPASLQLATAESVGLLLRAASRRFGDRVEARLEGARRTLRGWVRHLGIDHPALPAVVI